MGVDALVALVVGRLFDRVGLLVLIAAPIAGIPVAPLAFSTSYGMALLGVIFLGCCHGCSRNCHESSDSRYDSH
jgi:hypothetical protein